MAYVGLNAFMMPNGVLTIQSAHTTDAQEILSFIRLAKSETDFLAQRPEEFNFTLQQEYNFIMEKLNNTKELFLIARYNGILVGIAVLASNGLYRCRHKGQLGIMVLRNYWGQGIGRKLLDILVKWADVNGIIKITLEVDALNTRAINLYRAFGFIEEGYLKMDRCMEDGRFRDSLVMARFNPSVKL
ncbi:MAG: GNAT family N-acetyltransferase [Clostridiaceae bacterium]|nr:GNAT family N-acetyltransferase [Clostridiaceae bacterium]